MTFAPFHRPACAHPVRRLLGGLLLALCALAASAAASAAELVEIDSAGVIRWRADGREVALFGANYCLPSASDYRAAKRTGADLPKLIEQDFTHFARLGWDGLRLSFWGDWENSDREGNLIANEHLDLLDRCIAEAKKRGLYVLFSPITNHASWWPDMKEKDAPNGFSKFFEKSKLGTDPKAIAVQANYLRQIMAHVNPYTGVALKDEPQILFVELINEPWHHSDDQAGSIAYINTLTDAVRSGGCEKLVFHNVSQDFAIAPAIRASRAQGVTFGWYPTGLINGHTLKGNQLRSVDDYPPMRAPELRGLPSLVYEFDSADMAESTMYPAMVRTFRSVGAQFAAAFSYDMLATAPANAGWQTHLLNLVYTPRKAVASAIAAEAMRRLPRGENYGPYPANLRFGPFRIDPDANLAELALPDVFMHAGDTSTAPPAPDKLERIVGFGSSPLVSYEGLGAYFLDRHESGAWRLEVYPDTVNLIDPFKKKADPQTPTILLYRRATTMTVRLPGLAPYFSVHRAHEEFLPEAPPEMAIDHTIRVRPGVYWLGTNTQIRAALKGSKAPREIVLPESEYRVPLDHDLLDREFVVLGQPVPMAFDLMSERPLEDVVLHVRDTSPKSEALQIPMPRIRGYRHEATIPANFPAKNGFLYHITARYNDGDWRFPFDNSVIFLPVLQRNAALNLFHANWPESEIALTNGDLPRGDILKRTPAKAWSEATLRFRAPKAAGRHRDFSLSRNVTQTTQSGALILRETKELVLRYRTARRGWTLLLSLVERDGTTWSVELPESTGWTLRRIPLGDFHIGRGVQLPTGYPGNWNYWRDPAAGRGAAGDHVHLDLVEHVQFSFRAPNQQDANLNDAELELEFLSTMKP